jgi:hypothetical protein
MILKIEYGRNEGRQKEERGISNMNKTGKQRNNERRNKGTKILRKIRRCVRNG